VSGDYTFLLAMVAGLISFVSPCVLPLVPAYLGQLTAVAVAAQGAAATPSRWAAVRHAVAYVAGFGSVFTLLGITATFAGGVLADYLPALRIIGGVVLVVMGLSLAGILRIPVLERTWRPLDAGASASLTTMTGGMTLAPAGGGSVGSHIRLDRDRRRIGRPRSVARRRCRSHCRPATATGRCARRHRCHRRVAKASHV